MGVACRTISGRRELAMTSAATMTNAAMRQSADTFAAAMRRLSDALDRATPGQRKHVAAKLEQIASRFR